MCGALYPYAVDNNGSIITVLKTGILRRNEGDKTNG